MDYKDTIIDELKRENHALRHGPGGYDGTVRDLHTVEDTLALAIADRQKAEDDLRHLEDHNTVHINAVDADRISLKSLERERFNFAASLKAELAALTAQVNTKKADLNHLRADYDHARCANLDLKNQIKALHDDIAHERVSNDALTVELNKINDGIEYNTHTVEYGLRNDNARSSNIQADLHARIKVLEGDNASAAIAIGDRNDTIKLLDHDLGHRHATVDDLNGKINYTVGRNYEMSKDNDHYVVRNFDLDALVTGLKVRLADGNREIAVLKDSIADLSAANSYKQDINYHLERNIDRVNGDIGHLSYHNRNIDHDVYHIADREAYWGNFGKANYLSSKRRVYDDDLKASANHVEYVRATSPARSPTRRFY